MSVLKAAIFDLDNTLLNTESLRAYREEGRFSEITNELRAETRIYKPVLNMLRRLRDAGVSLGVLTNSPSSYAIPLLRHHDLEQYFSAVVTYSHVGHDGKKPSPKGLIHTLGALGISDPSAAIYVGDEAIDVMAAYRAGVYPITPTWATRKSMSLAPYASLSSAGVMEIIGDIEEKMLFAERCSIHGGTEFARKDARFLALDENSDVAPIRTKLRTFCLGRYFSQKNETTALLHDRHALSLEIAKKDHVDDYRPPEWMADMLFKVIKSSPQFLFDGDGRKIDLVTIIPRKPGKLERLEYVLADMRAIAEGLGVRLDFDPEVFYFDGDAAKSLRGHSASQRKEEQNAHLHIAKIKQVEERNVIVIDDVVTTGATINRAIDLLYSAGCSSAYGIGVAKTVSISEEKKPCPKCRRDMLIRKNHGTGERFWSCSGYMDARACTHTEPLEVIVCPRCSRTMRLQKNKRDGSHFMSCSGWNKVPKCNYTYTVKKR